ncbi:MAG TPA: 50S ribosomal protein L11 methyltransferase [Clostridiales bacterium]|nr:50S ribosomal protein L11 methyltransferase [Clostridiales bacterium]
MDWYEILLKVPTEHTEMAVDISNMVVPHGIFIEDYSDLEQGALEIAHIDLIDEDLLRKDRDYTIIHIYISDADNLAEGLEYLKERLSALRIPFEINTSSVNESDWADNWKKYFKTTEIGQKLVIQPSWEEYYKKTDRVVLKIDPGAAFGTGTHATTRLCLELIEKFVKPLSTVLDIGCGSGILSIAAVLFGAKRAVGVDIEPLAVKVSKQNAEINGVSDKTEFLQGNLTDRINQKYDIVCANIVADAIIRLSADIGKYINNNGIFLCSGIIDIRAKETESALLANGFRIIEHKNHENWNAYVAVLT